jgi:HPt (histidine-containing phosphotransfer) domain-containing protein
MPHHLLLDMQIFAEFRDLLPHATVQQQLHTLLDAQHTALGAMEALLMTQREQGGRVAHQLKGACLLMGFNHMAGILARIEHAALRTQDVVPAKLLEELRAAANDTRLVVAGILPAGVGRAAPD